ncbi:MAG: GNAT family N-acetyltransferase, partial [Promethearchaeota archaeon]
THPDFENRGFATSVVSASIQELLKHSPLGLIHVRADNAPAVHTYKKNGFRDFLQFYFLKSAQ